MSDERLDRELSALPPDEPSPDFTRRVLARVAAARRAPSWATRVLPLAGAAIALVAVPVLRCLRDPGATRAPAVAAPAELEALRNEKARLASRLAALRTRIEERRPVVYLGGAEETALVLDVAYLPSLADVRPAAGAPTPAGEETDDRH